MLRKTADELSTQRVGSFDLPPAACAHLYRLQIPAYGRGRHQLPLDGAQVHLRVTIPQKLNAEEKRRVEELRDLQPKAKDGKKFGPFKF